MEVREQVEIGPLTTLGVGGAARYFVDAHSEKDVIEALEWCRRHTLPLFVLGGGSNIVVSDDGWRGLVLKISIRGIDISQSDNRKLFSCGAGEDWDTVVARTVAENCAGMECLSGIPGTIGGTPVQNVGAYGQEVSETIVDVEAVEVATGAHARFSNADCGFAYRTSRFNTHDRGRYIITRVVYALIPGGAPKVDYADLKRQFAEREANPTLREVREAVLRIRASKGMVLDDNDPESRSAGSFFKNPIVPQHLYERVAEVAGTQGAQAPKYPADDGHVKIPAAWLIEHSGLQKGFQHGTVSISRKHTLALVNRGGAKAADVLAMKDLVQQKVRETFGIELQPEPVFVGFDLA